MIICPAAQRTEQNRKLLINEQIFSFLQGTSQEWEVFFECDEVNPNSIR